MANSQQLDVTYLDNVALPYDRLTKELDDSPRLVDGDNLWVDLGGKLRRRPSVRLDTTKIAATAVTAFDSRVVVYQTVEASPRVFLITSRLTSSAPDVWGLRYIELTAVTPTWTTPTEVRQSNSSEHPHEMIVANGVVYIRAFPTAASGEKLGTIIFDGTGGTVLIKFWGLLPPTTAANVTSSAGWSASTNATTINTGWKYAYSWKTNSGHISSRSPLATPLGLGFKSASDTGPFSNLRPKVEVQGDADTTRIPSIIIWRTTDGGDKFLYLDTITNTGAGTITYEDDERVASQPPNDPKTDFQLDPTNLAPSTTSNDPPPTVVAPQVTGTDTPKHTTKIVEFAGRLWYGIDNVLFYSGNEEIHNGSRFESFPSGTIGNFYRLKNVITNLEATNEVLYIHTTHNILRVTGSDLSSFRIRALFNNIGGLASANRSSSSFGDSVVFLTHDRQVAIIREDRVDIISAPLKGEIGEVIDAAGDTDTLDNVVVATHTFEGNQWFLVGVVDRTTPANSKIWCFDLVRQQWNTPWTLPFFSMISGRLPDVGRQELIFSTYLGTASSGNLVLMETEEAQDMFVASTPVSFALNGETNLFRVKQGNHVHTLRVPAAYPVLAGLLTERTKFASDTVPTIEFRLDEFSGSFTTATEAPTPPYLVQRTSYNIGWYPVQKMAQRVSMKISKTALAEKFELQSLGFVWNPEAGT